MGGSSRKVNIAFILVPVIITSIVVGIVSISAYLRISSWIGGLAKASEEKKGNEQITFTSDDRKSRITTSKEWEKGDPELNKDASLIIFTKDEKNGLIIIRESKEDFEEGYSIDDYTSLILDLKREEGSKVDGIDVVNIRINNYNARQCEFEWVQESIRYKYMFSFIETSDSFYQVVAWTLKSNFDRRRNEFINITNSFTEINHEEF